MPARPFLRQGRNMRPKKRTDTASDYRHRTGRLTSLHPEQGDVIIQFRKDRKEDVEKARQIVTNLLQAGYTILAKDKSGRHRRVRKFQPSKASYIIAEVGGDIEVPATEARAVAIPPQVGG